MPEDVYFDLSKEEEDTLKEQPLIDNTNIKPKESPGGKVIRSLESEESTSEVIDYGENIDDEDIKDERKIASSIQQFFTRNPDENKKYLNYKNGEVEYVRDNNKNYEDVITDSRSFIKEKANKVKIKNIIIALFVVYIFTLPFIIYGYISGDDKEVNPIKGPEFINSNKNTLNIETPNSDHVVKSNDVDIIEASAINIVDEITLLNNETIIVTTSFLDNKLNRHVLKSNLESILVKQNDLNKYIDVNKNQLIEKDIKNIQAVLTEDLAITKKLIELIDDKFTRANVDLIYSSFEN